jgi:8-oxo-dGTP pyrophosphatase MutT (NUDIX family)
MLEAIAGMLDTETPEDDARREAMEEAGVRLGQLYGVGQFWSVPAFATETIDYYLAPYTCGDRIEAGGGHPDEQEHITVHELGLEDLWAMFERNEIKDVKAVVLLMALRIREPHLFEKSDDLPAHSFVR